MLTIGINSRAAGVLTGSDSYRASFDLPVSARGVDWRELESRLRQIRGSQSARMVIEHIGPQVHVEPAFEIAAHMRLSLELIAPAAWRRGLALASFDEAPIRRARALYPDAGLLIDHHDRAAALLLAHWAVAGRSQKRAARPRQGFRDQYARARAREHGRL